MAYGTQRFQQTMPWIYECFSVSAKRLAGHMKDMHHCHSLHIIKHVLPPLATVLE